MVLPAAITGLLIGVTLGLTIFAVNSFFVNQTAQSYEQSQPRYEYSEPRYEHTPVRTRPRCENAVPKVKTQSSSTKKPSIKTKKPLDPDEKCSICLDLLKSDVKTLDPPKSNVKTLDPPKSDVKTLDPLKSDVKTLDCGHSFHEKCYAELISNDFKVCPVCRKAL